MAIYKHGRGFELGTTEHKSSKWPERDSNPGPPDCESDAVTTRLRCLPAKQSKVLFVLHTRIVSLTSNTLCDPENRDTFDALSHFDHFR